MVGVGGMPTNSQTLPTPWLGWLARCGWLDASQSHLRELLDRSRALGRDLSNKLGRSTPGHSRRLFGVGSLGVGRSMSAALAGWSVLARSVSAARRRPLSPAGRCWLARCRPLGVGRSRRLFGVGSLVRVALSVGGNRRECIGRPPCQGRFASRLRRDQVASRPDPLTWSLSAANEQAPWAGSACPPLAPAIPTGLVRHPASLARHCLGRRSLPARHPASLARHCVVRHPASCAGPLG